MEKFYEKLIKKNTSEKDYFTRMLFLKKYILNMRN